MRTEDTEPLQLLGSCTRESKTGANSFRSSVTSTACTEFQEYGFRYRISPCRVG